MAHDKMYECQKKTLFKIDDQKVWKWKKVSVSGLSKGDNTNLRCQHCYGSVLVAQQQQIDGPADHVRHQSSQDSKNCLGGSLFEGEHKISSNPVDPDLPIFEDL